MYSNVVGGKLKLKGVTPEAPSHGKKKKKSKSKNKEEYNSNNSDNNLNDNNDEEENTSNVKVTKTLTEAEKRHKEKLAKKEQKRINQLVSKSHKEKIEEYNKYLSSLSEHHDVPKVGPG